MAIKPITCMLRRQLVRDLAIGTGCGFVTASFFWYGFHKPRTVARDNYYTKLEDERAKARAEAE